MLGSSGSNPKQQPHIALNSLELNFKDSKKSDLHARFRESLRLPIAKTSFQGSSEFYQRNTFNTAERPHFVSNGQPAIEIESSSINLRTSFQALQEKITNAKKTLQIMATQASECKYLKSSMYNKMEDMDGKLIDSTINLESNARLVKEMPVEDRASMKLYYVGQLLRALDDRNSVVFQHINLTKYVLNLKNSAEIQSWSKQKVILNRHAQDANRKTLVIDLDETLLHCDSKRKSTSDIIVTFKGQNGSQITAYISTRTYALSFLRKMSKLFEIITFTASEQIYADAVIDGIDPHKQLIRHRLYRQHCVKMPNNMFVKNLRILGRDLKQTILLDNSPYSYLAQRDNGVPILPYFSGEDSQLLNLEKYLQELAKCEDVQVLNRKTFRLIDYLGKEGLSPEELIKQVYCV